VNAAILILAATIFFKTGNSQVAEIKEAHRLLPGFLGNFAPKLFAIALIAAGQSSTITGTLAGQIIMEGYLKLRINPLMRRLITRLLAIIPALLVILIYGEEKVDALLVLSQVILSLQLGFAIIPLIHFVSDKKTMGIFTIKPFTKIAAWLIASILIFLNCKWLTNEVSGIFSGDSLSAKLLVVLAGILFASLLLYIMLEPFFQPVKKLSSIKIHPEMKNLKDIPVPEFKRIAVALDFSDNDNKLIAYAMAQGKKNTSFLLIHIVESASAKLLGIQSDDFETRKDQEQINWYVQNLKEIGLSAEGYLGFKNRAKEIVRIVKDNNVDMLVIGAHGHTGLKDFIYGETVNTVRHELRIPVLIVHL
jgi:manganese transport protein